MARDRVDWKIIACGKQGAEWRTGKDGRSAYTGGIRVVKEGCALVEGEIQRGGIGGGTS